MLCRPSGSLRCDLARRIPTDLNDPTAVLLAVHSALRTHGIDAATYGGLALAAYGTPRETKDADLAVAGIDLVRTMEAIKTIGPSVKLAFERTKFGGNVITRFTLLPRPSDEGLNTVDLVEPRSERFAALVLSRAFEGELLAERIRIVTPEDFVLLKVLSTREKDLEDARSVLAALAGQIDCDAIRAEAALLAKEIPDHPVMELLGKTLPARS